MATVTVRGYGGAEFEMDVPVGGQERENFDAQVASGFLTILDGSVPTSEPEVDLGSVPDGTMRLTCAMTMPPLLRAACAVTSRS